MAYMLLSDYKKASLDFDRAIVFNEKDGELYYLSGNSYYQLGENVIAVATVLPSEFDLERFIDYDLQFDKSFLQPVKNILDVIGWKSENMSSLESFFGHLKGNLNVHRGLSLANRKNFLKWYLYYKNQSNK